MSNYLDNVPVHTAKWSVDKNGNVAIETENRGLLNRIAQKLLKKPKISYIHLDKVGSFVWQQFDGKTTINEIGVRVEEKFGKEVKPTFERIAKFLQILKNCGFVKFKI